MKKIITPFLNDITFNNSSLPQTLLNTDLTIIDINSVGIELMKYSKDELVGKNLNTFLTDQTHSLDNIKNKALLENKISHYIISRKYRDKLGNILEIDINISLFECNKTKEKYFLIIFYLQEKALPIQTNNNFDLEKLKIILDKSPVNQFVFDHENNKVLYENRELLESLGYSVNDYSFEARKELFLSKLLDIESVLVNKGKANYTFGIYDCKNELKWLSQNFFPISKDKDGNLKISYGTSQDITEIVNNEIKIKKQQEYLDNHNKQLEEQLIKIVELENFVSITSHDLKEPIRSIRNYTQILIMTNKQNLGKDGKELIELIKSSTDKIYERIEAILSFSRITNSISEYKEMDIKILIENVIEELKREIGQKQSQITLKLKNKIIYGEVKQLEQLFKNILNNAIKFTNDEHSKIEILLRECDDFWRFSIKDNGIGIPIHEFSNIFKIFKKLHDDDKYKGQGIGLSICKRIIERHQGEIWVESNIDKGSIFHFTISKKIK